MAGMLSGKAQKQLATLLEGRRKLDRIHSLIEQYATARGHADHFAGLIARSSADVGRVFLNSGFGVMADHANTMASLAKRGGATQTKFRGLRELVSHLRAELDRAEKGVVAADKEADEPADESKA